MGELTAENLRTADRPAQHTFVYYSPQHRRLGPVQDPLPLEPRRDMPADLLVTVCWLGSRWMPGDYGGPVNPLTARAASR
jgi:hypothetical protein